MRRDEWRAAAESLLAHARAVRDGLPPPHWDAMDGLAWGQPPDAECAAIRAAMRYLADEVAGVRAGRATGLYVLDDEIAGLERAFARLDGEPAPRSVGDPKPGVQGGRV